MTKIPPVPEPRPTRIVCSVCALDWDAHLSREETPSLATCVELLRAELNTRPRVYASAGTATSAATPWIGYH